MADKKFQATRDDIGKRLDKFLSNALLGISRSQIQKKIQEGLVLVNGKKTPAHQFLKEGDIVELRIKNYELSTGEAKGASSIITEPKIIFEDKNYFVLEKPSGMLVHPVGVDANGNRPIQKNKTTLVDWLTQKYPEIKNVGEEKYRDGIIHRLDKEVSGIMLVSRTQKGYAHLKQQFKDRKVKKIYLALVYGIPGEPHGTIELPIGRSPEGKFVAHPRNHHEKYQEEDKHAITKYRVIKNIRDYAFLEVEILTGRTHQIRAHLSAIGHPIVGDRDYGPTKPFFKKFSKRIKVLNPPRIFLHSHLIGFFDENNKWREFTSPLPHEINKFMETIAG